MSKTPAPKILAPKILASKILAPLTATKPFAAFEWMIAGRYLRPRRKEGFISVITLISFLGIMLGVATLIVVLSVMNGFRKELLGKILGLNGHLLIQPLDQPLSDFNDIVARASKVAGVRLVVPFVEGQAFLSSASTGSGVLVRGVRDEDVLNIPSVAQQVRQGSLVHFAQSGGIAIGKRLANSLGVQVGDKVDLVSPRGAVTVFGQTPRIKSYPVVAIFEIGMSELDSLVVFMPMEEAQLYFNQPERATAIEMYVDDPDKIDAVRDGLNKAMDRPLFLTDWRQRNATFFSALEVERNMMFILLVMIVAVAALNIVSGLIMLVKDKAHDVAILRTMGATRGSILRIFLINGASIGFSGTFGGFILGLVICLNVEEIRQFVSSLTRTQLFAPEIYFLSRLPAELNAAEVVVVVSISLVLSLAATLYPSWRAASLDPVEALRYE